MQRSPYHCIFSAQSWKTVFQCFNCNCNCNCKYDYNYNYNYN